MVLGSWCYGKQGIKSIGVVLLSYISESRLKDIPVTCYKAEHPCKWVKSSNELSLDAKFATTDNRRILYAKYKQWLF